LIFHAANIFLFALSFLTQLDYYWLPLDSPNRDLTITVTALTGDPDLYVSRNTITPNATNNELSATFYGGMPPVPAGSSV
jgi:hypothetical protein